MIDVDKAISFIKANGTCIELARMKAILGYEFDMNNVLLELRKMQSNNG